MYVTFFHKSYGKETKLGIIDHLKYNQTFGKINEYQIEHSRVKIPDELIVSRFCANIKIALVIEF